MRAAALLACAAAVLSSCVDVTPPESLSRAPEDPDAAAEPDAYVEPDAAPEPDLEPDGYAPPPDVPLTGMRINGTVCDDNAQCASGHCVDRFCCDAACDGACESCAVASQLGRCSPVPAGQDPADDCPADPMTSCMRDGTCDGNRGCRLAQDGATCVASTCANGVQAPARTCNGAGTCRAAGAQIVCSPYLCDSVNVACRTSCTDNAHCQGSRFCAGNACTEGSNIATMGSPLRWFGMTAATANTNATVEPGLTDGNLTADVSLTTAGADDAVAAWEAAGVLWTNARTFSRFEFVNGAWTATTNGVFSDNVALQVTQDGTTWANVANATVSPAYAYDTMAAASRTYTLTPPAAVSARGVRVVGQVRTRTNSWYANVNEVRVFGM